MNPEHISADDWELHQVVFGCQVHPDSTICTFLRSTAPGSADELHIPGYIEQTG